MTNITTVAPLSISGGRKSESATQLSNISTNLTKTIVQSTADGEYDPNVESGTPTIITGFCSPSADVSHSLMMIGILLIVYGVIAK